MKAKATTVILGLAITVAAALFAQAEPGSPAKPVASAWRDVPPQTKVVGVDAVAKDAKAHVGKVAIEGIVSKVFSERGAFTLIDLSEFSACGVTSCAENSVPVMVPKNEFQGDLPKERDTVLVLGDLDVQGKGYRFLVQEVRTKDKTLLKRARPAAGASPAALAEPAAGCCAGAQEAGPSCGVPASAEPTKER